MALVTYYPILKWKKGEQVALTRTTYAEGNLHPIIELIDDCTADDFVASLGDIFAADVYVDTTQIDEDATLLQEIINAAARKDMPVWPLLRGDTLATWDEFKGIAQRIAIVLPIPEDYRNPLSRSVFPLLKIKPNSLHVDLILDAGSILKEEESRRAYESLEKALNQIMTKGFNNVQAIVCATSFPEVLSTNAGENSRFTRYDIDMFSALYENFAPHLVLGYADYGVTKFTDSDIDFSMLRYGVLPKIKYTTDDAYIVLKGKRNNLRNVLTRSYIDMSKELVKSDDFFGNEFSYADGEIYIKATRAGVGPGSNTNWVTYCANHHIAVLLEQLSTLTDS